MCYVSENKREKDQRKNPVFAEMMADYWSSKRRGRTESLLNFDDLIMSSCELPAEEKQPERLGYIGRFEDGRISEEDYSYLSQTDDRDNLSLR